MKTSPRDRCSEILLNRIIGDVYATVEQVWFSVSRMNITRPLMHFRSIINVLPSFSLIKNDSFHVPGQSLHGFTVVRYVVMFCICLS